MFMRIELALCLLLVSCTRETAPPSARPDAGGGPTAAAPSTAPAVVTQPKPKPAAPDDPMPDPITHPCVVTAAQFDVAVREGDKSCQKDADCECIPERIGSRYACGGVTAKRNGAKLRELAKEFAAMKCESMRKCKQAKCEPRCVDGQCQ